MKKLIFILFLFIPSLCFGATRTISVLGGNWDSTTAWTELAVPVDGDDVVATALSGNLVVNVNTANLNSFDLTNYVGILSGGSLITVAPASGTVVCKFAGTITWLGNYFMCNPTSGAIINFTYGTFPTTSTIFLIFGGSGTVNQQDNIVNSSSGSFLETGDIWNTNNHDITIPYIQNDSTAVVNLGSSVITLTGLGWNTIDGVTLNSGTSTIIINDTSATAKSFIGGGLTYNTVTFSGDNITITRNNTFNTLNVNTAGLATGLIFTNGTTQTVTNFTTNGYASNLAKISSDSAGVPFTLTTSSAQISVDYMSIKDSTATEADTWYAGANSTSVSGNSGWIFTAPPAPANKNIILNGGTSGIQINGGTGGVYLGGSGDIKMNGGTGGVQINGGTGGVQTK